MVPVQALPGPWFSPSHLPSVLNLEMGEGMGGAEEKGAQVLGKAYWSAA